MLDIEHINDQTLSDIMENLETEDPGDVACMSAGEAIDRFLTWNGIQGFTGMILDGVDSIRAADTVQELRELVNPPDCTAIDIDDLFIDVFNCLDHHGHMGNETLKLCCLATRQSITKIDRSLALLKIRELIS